MIARPPRLLIAISLISITVACISIAIAWRSFTILDSRSVPFPSALDARRFGAKCDGVADDAHALLNLISAADRLRLPIMLPAGECRAGAAISATVRNSLIIRGAGAGITKITWTGKTDGLSLTTSDVSHRVILEGLSLLTTATSGAGTALTITGPSSVATTYQPGPVIRDVLIAGSDTRSQSWLHGIRFNNSWYSRVEQVICKGKDGEDAAGVFTMRTCIEYDKAQVMYGRDVVVEHVGLGVNKPPNFPPGVGEGLNYTGFQMVGVEKGFVLGGNAIGDRISGGHINCYVTCIEIATHQGLAITDNVIFRNENAAGSWVGINISNSQNLVISGNNIEGPCLSRCPSGSSTNIKLRKVVRSNVSGNIFDWWNVQKSTGIAVGPDSATDVFVGNIGGPNVALFGLHEDNKRNAYSANIQH